MLTKYYRKSASADALGTLFSNIEGIMTKVFIHNANDAETTIRLESSAGMVFFERVIPNKGDIIMDLDCYILNTETIKIYSSLAEVHCTVNFLVKA